MKSAGIICVDETGHTLIVQQYGKSWCFPKGRIEESDVTPLHTASREFREETGMVSIDDPITFGYNIVQDGTVYMKIHDYWNKEQPKYNGICFTHRDDPVNATITRPVFNGTGWVGDDKEITYYLCVPSAKTPYRTTGEDVRRQLHNLDLSGTRDPAITDVKIIRWEQLKKYTYAQLMHPAEYNAFIDIWDEYSKREKGVNVGDIKFRLDENVTEMFSDPSNNPNWKGWKAVV